MPFTGFEQDPNAEPGWGTFTNDQGQRGYFNNPQLAQQLAMGAHDQFGPPPDPKAQMAGPPVADLNAIRSEAAPPPPQGPPPEPVDPREVGSNALVQRAFSPVHEAPRQGGFRPKGQTLTVESGAPYSEEDAQTRADLNTNVRAAHLARTEQEASREMASAEGARAAMPVIQARADAAQAERDQLFQAYQADRAELQHLMDASASKQIDPKRLFKTASGDVNPLAVFSSVIAQALGTYSSARYGGVNQPQELINRAIDQDIQAQRHEYDASQGKVRNAFALLNDRYRDAGQAEAALRLVQQQVAANQVAAFAGASKSQDIKAAAAEWDAANQAQREESEEKLRAAAMGKRTLQGTAAYQAPSAGGTRERTDAEINRGLDTAGKFNQVTGLTGEREAALKGDSGKAAKETRELTIYDLQGNPIQAARPEEATKIRNAAGLRAGAARDLEQIKHVVEKSKVGGRVGEAKGQVLVLMKRALEKANTMGGQGQFKTDDAEQYAAAMFGAAGGVRLEVLDELLATIDHDYQSMVDAQHGPALKVEQSTKGPQTAYTGRAANAPTAPSAGGPKRTLP